MGSMGKCWRRCGGCEEVWGSVGGGVGKVSGEEVREGVRGVGKCEKVWEGVRGVERDVLGECGVEVFGECGRCVG